MSTYASFQGCMHGLSAEHVRLYRDEDHGAAYLHLDQGGNLNIRIQVRPGRYEEPESHAAELERDREGLLKLAELAVQVAQEIEQLKQTDGAQ